MKNTLKRTLAEMAAFTLAICSLTACGNNNSDDTTSEKHYIQTDDTSDNDTKQATAKKSSSSSLKATNTSYINNNSGVIDTTDLFSDRDLEQTIDTSDMNSLTVSDGKTLDITEEGIYAISGSAKNCTIMINADKESKIQLVLDNVDIENDDFPAIYVVSADKVFVTTDSDSSLSITGSFKADSETNTDAVIYSKDDLVLNGTGALTISSPYGNAVSCKDDLKITGGTYDVNCAADAFEANDSIAICDGDFIIKTDKDAFHCENDEDSSLGSIYISGGNFEINAASDGIQGTTYVQIDGGTFDITASEGIEATYVQINGGDITISASDDGINASNKSNYCDVVIEFNGGTTTITMGQGDTDGVDANGSIYVNGGTIDVTAQMSSFDYDVTAEFNGGTIIINGEEVSEIPESMFGGGPMGGHGGFGGGMTPPSDGNFKGRHGNQNGFDRT